MINQLWVLDTKETWPYKNLALEEYLLTNVPEDTCILFLWQNRHTIVIGRNQNLLKECNVENVQQDGVFIVRRLSGGGAVFHDMGNLNFTFLVNRQDYNVDRQLEVIVEALAALGITAEKTGRNDIHVQDRKISGNAFYQKNDRCYHHGTLLIDTDKTLIERYLTVSKEKLALKGVDSVKARVANLKDFREDITVSMVKDALKEAFGRVYHLPAAEVAEEDFPSDEIARMAQRFHSEDWNYGKKCFSNKKIEQHFAWGRVEFLLHVAEGVIKELRIYSDAMEQDYIMHLQEALCGCAYSEERMAEVIDQVSGSETTVQKQVAEKIGNDIKSMIQCSDL